MIMWQDLVLVLSMGLAGLAGAGLVRAPDKPLGRIGLGRSPSSRSGIPAILRARPDAIPARVRVLLGLGTGLLPVPLLLASVVPAVGYVCWLVGPSVAAAVIYLLGRVQSPTLRRRRARMVIDLPHVLELMAAAMEAGLPLRNATRQVVVLTDGPLTDDLHELMTSIDLGRSDAQAWRRLRTHPVLDRVALDLARSSESGTMVVASLRHHAEAARRLRRGALEARAKTVGVKSVPPLVACFVPAFLLLGIVPTGVALFQGFLS